MPTFLVYVVTMPIDPNLPHRAQTSEEKEAVLEALAKAWKAQPELRLGQLITNCLRYHPKPRPCTFFVEDKPLLGALNKIAAGEPYPQEEE